MIGIEAVEGQTAPIFLYLKIDGAVPANPDGTTVSTVGFSFEFVVHSLDGDEHPITGSVTVQDAATWLLAYSPDPDDLLTGRWRCRMKATDGAGKIAYFPSGEWSELRVRGE
jgi:hypothetical protein